MPEDPGQLDHGLGSLSDTGDDPLEGLPEADGGTSSSGTGPGAGEVGSGTGGPSGSGAGGSAGRGSGAGSPGAGRGEGLGTHGRRPRGRVAGGGPRRGGPRPSQPNTGAGRGRGSPIPSQPNVGAGRGQRAGSPGGDPTGNPVVGASGPSVAGGGTPLQGIEGSQVGSPTGLGPPGQERSHSDIGSPDGNPGGSQHGNDRGSQQGSWWSGDQNGDGHVPTLMDDILAGIAVANQQFTEVIDSNDPRADRNGIHGGVLGLFEFGEATPWVAAGAALLLNFLGGRGPVKRAVDKAFDAVGELIGSLVRSVRGWFGEMLGGVRTGIRRWRPSRPTSSSSWDELDFGLEPDDVPGGDVFRRRLEPSLGSGGSAGNGPPDHTFRGMTSETRSRWPSSVSKMEPIFHCPTLPRRAARTRSWVDA